MLFIGIDISKVSFNAALLNNQTLSDRQFDNTEQGFKLLAKWVSSLKLEAVFCLESTGIYSLGLAQYLYQKKLTTLLVNPIKTHAFAKMEMSRSKTDKADAQSIAKFCQYLFNTQQISKYLFQPQSEAFEQLRYLVVRLEQLSIAKTQETNHLESSRNKTVIRSIKSFLRHIEQQQSAIEKDIQTLCMSDAQLNNQIELLNSIPAIGDKTAWRILAYLGDVSFFNTSKQVTSYAGLNPRIEQSGTSLNKSRLSKMGHKRLRKSMYMPALVAIQYHPKMVEMYQRLQEKGKPKKVAIVAVMRKLLVLSYGVLKSGKKYDLNYQG